MCHSTLITGKFRRGSDSESAPVSGMGIGWEERPGGDLRSYSDNFGVDPECWESCGGFTLLDDVLTWR